MTTLEERLAKLAERIKVRDARKAWVELREGYKKKYGKKKE